MSKNALINIAKDFSEEPIGRHPADSPYCGEIFRDNYLAPALRSNDVVTVLLDGTEGFGSSFLEEAFGGLVRVSGFKHEQLKAGRLRFVSDEDSSLIDEIWQYIESARPL